MTQIKEKTLALIGLGAAAHSIHLPAYKKTQYLRVVGGFDPAVKTDDASMFDFPIFDSADELIEKTTPDIVAIATPTQFHYELCKKALAYDCHVFCEKPFTTTIEEGKALIKLAEEKKCWIVVNNEFRFMNIYEAAKHKIGDTAFGNLVFVHASQTFYVDEKTEAGWRGSDPQRTCKEFGIHVLDLCRYFFDEEPITISATMPKPHNPQGPDYLNLIDLTFSQGRTAHITLDRLTRGRHRYLDLRLDGTHGSIETEFGGNIQLAAGIRGGDRKPYLDFDISLGGRAQLFQRERARKIASDPLDIFANATSKLLTRFIKALNENTTPACCAQDNIKTLALTLMAYESDKLGRPLPFAELWASP